MKTKTRFVWIGLLGVVFAAGLYIYLQGRNGAVVASAPADNSEALGSATPSGITSDVDPGSSEVASASAPVYAPNVALASQDRPLITQLDQLKEAAKTDVSTAFDLGRVISVCALAPVEDHSLEQLVNQGGAGVKAAEQFMDRQDYCAGLKREDFEEALSLLERSASQGLTESQVAYVDLAGIIVMGRPEYRLNEQMIARYKQNALAFLNAAAARGNTDALARIAQMYDDGIIVPSDPERAAHFYRLFMERSGRNSELDQRYLRRLEERAKAPSGG